MNDDHPSQTLARFAATLRFEDIPAAVVRRAEDLFLDWFGSALAGKGARPVETIAQFAKEQGPADGPSEVLISRQVAARRASLPPDRRLEVEELIAGLAAQPYPATAHDNSPQAVLIARTTSREGSAAVHYRIDEARRRILIVALSAPELLGS